MFVLFEQKTPFWQLIFPNYCTVRNGEPSVSEKRKSKQIPRIRKSEDKFENITKNPTRLKGPARFGEVLNH
ncbi:hypothetical protein T12_8114 [Trichinella patagoniensis]|uniref:Uncharacterized protein n=1 Tax=Trichinella patagoniensis TaxID=990121 RepID=A0A0V1A0F3_9BILA|nr:hypothetical protein T12_8114 [Trichinella patagoniensis]